MGEHLIQPRQHLHQPLGQGRDQGLGGLGLELLQLVVVLQGCTPLALGGVPASVLQVLAGH